LIFDQILYVIEKEKVILIATTRCAALRFSSKASTVHKMFHIQCKGYIWPLQKLNVEFQILKETDIIITGEMSMMMDTLLQNIETKLCQVENDTNEPYHYKLMIWWAIIHSFQQYVIAIYHTQKIIAKKLRL
jgi:hypothetical protein